jgi:mono/diheme cytochrome c family protein
MVRWKTMQHMVIGAILVIAIAAPIGVVVYVKSGVFNVAASKPHTDFTEWLTHETMIHSVRRHAKGIEAPRQLTAQQVVSGFRTYETHCAACHGAAAVARSQWVSGLEPGPPYLLDSTRRWSPSELFWIVKNGIKMTGMPSWRDSMSDAQIWEVVAWLEASAKLPPQTYATWRSRQRCGGFSGPWPTPELCPTRPSSRARQTGAIDGSAPFVRDAARP